jgi:hypothetical protein
MTMAMTILARNGQFLLLPLPLLDDDEALDAVGLSLGPSSILLFFITEITHHP